MKQLNIILSLAAVTVLAASSIFAHQGEKHEGASGEEVTVTGEVIDMVCYIDEGASGPQDGAAGRHQGKRRQDVSPHWRA
jgi:type 1 fimbria pilin